MAMVRCTFCQQALSVSNGAAGACPACRTAMASSGKHWLVIRDDRQAGPIAFAHLQDLALRSQLRPDDVVMRDGAEAGLAVRSIPQLNPQQHSRAGKAGPVRSPQSKRSRPVAILIGMVAGIALAAALAFAIVGLFAYRAWSPADAGPRPLALVKDETKKIFAPEKNDDAKQKNAPPTADGPDNPNDKKDPPPEKKPPEKKPVATPDPNQAKVLTETLVRQLNTYRKTAGLGLVQVDVELTGGCAAHAKYLALNPPTGPGDAVRLLEEDPGKPGFSEEGQRAASFAMVAVGDPKAAVDQWMGRLGGRLPLLQPDLRSIGVALEPVGGGAWAAVLDVLRGGQGERVVFYPAPGQENVPLTCSGGAEFADPNVTAGFPVSATFPPAQKVTQVKAELLNDAAKPVSVWLFTPEKPARDKGQRNTVALIAKAPLAGNRVYRVQMSATVDGAPWTKAWTFTTEDDADGKGVWAKHALDKVNGFRKLAGLKSVALDAELSKGCLAHARYLALNLGHPATFGLKAHDEDLQLPGASEDGRSAGKASDIAIGDHDPLHGIDAWMATLYHRVPILEPNLKTIGYGCARARQQGWVTVMNVNTGRDRKTPRPHPVYYPVPDQTGVPLHFPRGGEVPNPIPDDKTGKAGFPVTAFFPDKALLKAASAFLTDAAGKDVPVWFSSAETPANPKFVKQQRDTVCLIPREPLRPNTAYRVVLRGTVNGSPFEKDWQFTTGSAGPTPAQAAQHALDRLNAYRAAASLPLVTLDPALSKGCQSHADYLVRNAAVVAQKKLPANDEDPDLPGYTSHGLAAARQSDVFSQAPEPVTQVDDLMGTFMRRVYILDPQLRRIGFGCAHDVGRGWRCVLDMIGGRGGDRVVLFPAPDQEAVPCAGTGRLPGHEGAPGFPVSVTFPPQLKLLGGRGVLTDADGKTIETLLSTPERPLDPALAAQQRNTVSVHPLAPLRPGHTYSVTLSVVVNGLEWRQAWQFTTE